MAEPAKHFFNYLDIQRCTGLPKNTIFQHVTRGLLNPGKLESVVVYLARRGNAKLRQEIVEAALLRTHEEDEVGVPKKKRPPKKKAAG
jgi:hypothetical protein